jgi:hypothetical protein
MELNTLGKCRGKGYWKLNNQILSESTYCDGIYDMFDDICDEYRDVSKSLLWEYLKLRIKQYSISYCIERSKGRKTKVKELEENIDKLDKLIGENVDENYIQQRKVLKQELDIFYEEKANGAHIRSRAKWVEEGERSTAYFLGIEKNRQTNNVIDSLKDTKGIVQTNDETILEIAKEYYSNLYKTTKPSQSCIDEYFDNIDEDAQVRLSEADKLKCDGEVTFQECSEVLSKMKKNKSPGLDGLTVEFYSKFWNVLGPILVKVYNESFKNEVLPNTLNKSVMALIFKKGERSQISNYRPISLTNVDYKLLAFVLSARLQTVIGSLVSSDQTAYIKNRYLGTNIRLIEDIMEFFDTFERGGLLLGVDFEKAFDSLEWDFLHKTLDWFGFGDSFKKWVSTMYKDPSACVKNNGFVSEDFKITRGIRQGCPVSAILFILCVEILAIKIRVDENIPGFNLINGCRNIKISQYADDTVIFLNNTTELEYLFCVMETFGLVSGLKLSKTKSEGYWLGNCKYRQNTCRYYEIKWPGHFKYLGLYLGYNKAFNNKRNWDDKVDKLDQILKKWLKRDLSLLGKIQVIKALALPQLTLSASLLPIPNDVIKNVNDILFRFLWKSRDKVKRTKLINTYENGGLQMIDVQSYFEALKATWVSRILTADPCIDCWAQVPHVYFKPYDIAQTRLNFNFDDRLSFKQLESLPKFYAETLHFYNKALVNDRESFINNIHHEPIWGNKHIVKSVRNRKYVLFFENWISSGILTLAHLRFINGVLDDNHAYMTVYDKRNIYIEMKTIKNALLPYRDKLLNIPNGNAINQPDILCKSKIYYSKLLHNKVKDIMPISNYLEIHANNYDQREIFKCKVDNVPEIKLKEFNFKVLHGILACNYNLKKWRLRDDDFCDICNESQTIKHLLYECQYVKPLWRKVAAFCDIDIDFMLLLGCDIDNVYNDMISLICFLVYKEWLVLSLDNKSRIYPLVLKYYKEELNLRLAIYRRANLKERDIEKIERFVISLSV